MHVYTQVLLERFIRGKLSSKQTVKILLSRQLRVSSTSIFVCTGDAYSIHIRQHFIIVPEEYNKRMHI